MTRKWTVYAANGEDTKTISIVFGFSTRILFFENSRTESPTRSRVNWKREEK